MALWIVIGIVVVLALIVLPSLRRIGPTQVGLVTKRLSFKKLSEDNPIAFKGEAGFQAELLMPGLRFKFWILFKVDKFPWVQVPAGEIGVVISQVGNPLPIGAKSALYKPAFGNFTDLDGFIANGGQKGMQRPVLPPGTMVPIHPVAFLIITKNQVYGLPVSPELNELADQDGRLYPASFGLMDSHLDLVRISPQPSGDGMHLIDMVGIVTTYEGDPLPSGAIANRLGEFDDIMVLENQNAGDLELIEALLGSKNHLHNNYQDFQAFLDNGGKIGLQYDPLLYGAYALNPFLVGVELVPMLVVEQGQVAVIKAYVGLSTVDTSGVEFKFGSLVRPGHRGIWQEPLRTGKYPINPRVYQAEIAPHLTAGKMLMFAHGFAIRFNWIVPPADVDVTTADMLVDLVAELRARSVEILLAQVKGTVRDRLRRTGLMAELGEDRVYLSVGSAVTDFLRRHPVDVDPGPTPEPASEPMPEQAAEPAPEPGPTGPPG